MMTDKLRALALVVDCLLGFCSVGLLYYLFRIRPHLLTAFHAKLAMGIFSLTVTTVTVILGLSLPQNVFGQLSGQIGFITFTLAGPPAIWVLVFVTTAKVIADPALKVSINNNLVGPSPKEYYRTLGWESYRDWRANLNSYRRVMEKSELHFIDDLLPKVFYHGRFDLLKPESVTNTTLFFFTRKGAVKFQRIQAEARTRNGNRSEIYLPHTASTPQGQTTCLHFIRNENRLAQTGRHTHGEWKVAPFKNVDILLVAIYENDALEDGDYVYVDVSKYIDLELMDDASLELAIVSDRRIEEYNVWEVAASLVSIDKPVPLVFHNVDSQINRRSPGAIEKNLHQLAELFGDWDVLLDQAVKGVHGTTVGICNEEVDEFFGKLKSALDVYELEDSCTFQQLLHRPQAADCVITRLKQQQNVILSTFTWC